MRSCSDCNEGFGACAPDAAVLEQKCIAAGMAERLLVEFEKFDGDDVLADEAMAVAILWVHIS